jgi:type II secretory pathway component PulJ
MSRFCRPARNGYTLIELAAATASATLLVGGLASTVLISSRALSQDSTPTAGAQRSAQALAQFSADVRQALMFIERTNGATAITEQSTTAVAFTVPDRNGDSLSETVRYTWSGTAGNHLMYQLNSQTARAIAPNGEQFNLAQMTTAFAAVTFLVPDRNGDQLPETLRYSWSGKAGDPLMYQFNNEPAIALLTNVAHFELSAIMRSITP